MSFEVSRTDVWVAELEDKPGALAEKLKALTDAGADLEFMIARRAPDRPGTGVVFLTQLSGDSQIEVARANGFSVTKSLHSIRITGKDKPGIGAEITSELASAGINLRGLSAGVVDDSFIMHLALDSEDDAEKALKNLND
jgi:hypothetical protein